MVKMYENYENRVKDFIVKMTNPEQQIVVQDNYIINSSRQDIMNKRVSKKPFIFKGYITELDRIKQTIKKNRYLYNIDPPTELHKKKLYHSLSQKTTEKIKQLNKIDSTLDKFLSLSKYDVIIQPEMRFTARTDLERVFDALSGNYYRNSEKDILNRQLKTLDIFEGKKPIDIIKQEKQQAIEETEIEKDTLQGNITFIPNKLNKSNTILRSGFTKPSKPWIKRNDLNIEAQGILSEYHHKTHFKATKEIAENKIKWKKKKDEEEMQDINSKETVNGDSNIREMKKVSDEEKENVHCDIGRYDKNYNPIYKKNNVDIDPDSLKVLSILAFSSKIDENKQDIKINENNIKNNKMSDTNLANNPTSKKLNLVDDNNVLIGNELYNKRTQFDIIAAKVLNLCNIENKKSRCNDKNLKKGNGKLMMTRGMTLNQFEKKYNFKE